MKYKLILIFDNDSEVLNIGKILIFNNVLDAKAYLLSTEQIVKIEIDPDNENFSFSTKVWNGRGTAYWVVDNSI